MGVITVQNKGGKGNQNHFTSNGQFAPKDGNDSQTNIENSEEYKKVQKMESFMNSDEFQQYSVAQKKMFSMLFNKAKKDLESKEQSYISKTGNETGNVSGLDDYEIIKATENVKSILEKEKKEKDFNNLSEDEKQNFLTASLGLDTEKIKHASFQEIEFLLNYSTLDGELSDLLSEQQFLKQTNILDGVWKDKMVGLDDYFDVKDTIQSKKEYFKTILETYPNDEDFETNSWKQFSVNKSKQFLEKLENYEINSEKYYKLKEQYDTIKKIRDDSTNQKIVSKFKNPDDHYSKERKDKAIWFNTGSSYLNQKKATEYFGPEFEKKWEGMTSHERQCLIDYTGAYSKFNEPLRKIKYLGSKTFLNSSFVKDVSGLTSAIDKCTWNDDIWVQRGIALNTPFIKKPGESLGKSISDLSAEELQSLVGMTIEDTGFYSAGAGKDTGFSHNSVIINTYCPKGTKMAYMNTKGNFSYGNENEMILQRGYSYKITKVEKSSPYKFYIDVEVILGSDENKFDLSELENLQKNFSK